MDECKGYDGQANGCIDCRGWTYSEVLGATLSHQLIRLGFVLVIQRVKVETRFLQHNTGMKLTDSVHHYINESGNFRHNYASFTREVQLQKLVAKIKEHVPSKSCCVGTYETKISNYVSK